MSQALINHFETYLPFDNHERELIISRTSVKKLKRKETLLAQGTICAHYTFVVSGCLRMFAMDQVGKEHNLLFAAENEWIADIGSFHTERESTFEIQALEASEIIQIQQEDLYFLYLNVDKLNRVLGVIIEDKYVELQNRVFQNISSTGKQRYLFFLKKYPHLINRLPNTQIASYLGITPEFLSMIRKEIIRSN